MINILQFHSVVIAENPQKLTAPQADTTDLHPTGSALLESPQIRIPTLAEALTPLDASTAFPQNMSISTLPFPYTPTQLSVQELVDTIGQAQEGLKYYQQKHKVQASLKDFWAPTPSTLDAPSGSAI